MTDAARALDFDVLRFVANAGQNTGAGLAFVDPAGRYLFVSDGLAATNGLPAADHVGRSQFERDVARWWGRGLRRRR